MESGIYTGVFVNCSLGYASGGGTPDTTILHWVMVLGQTLLLEPSDCVFSLVPLDYFAVINSVAASVFPSDCCNKDVVTRITTKAAQENVLSHWAEFIIDCLAFHLIYRHQQNQHVHSEKRFDVFFSWKIVNTARDNRIKVRFTL